MFSKLIYIKFPTFDSNFVSFTICLGYITRRTGLYSLNFRAARSLMMSLKSNLRSLFDLMLMIAMDRLTSFSCFMDVRYQFLIYLSFEKMNSPLLFDNIHVSCKVGYIHRAFSIVIHFLYIIESWHLKSCDRYIIFTCLLTLRFITYIGGKQG